MVMASHGLVIAKASLVAAFMKPDPAPLSKEELTRFHDLLGSALRKCSSSNIQHCKEWLVKNHVASVARAGAVGKYLVALSSSLETMDRKRGSPSGRSQRLYVLYILNDLLHHYKYHKKDHSSYESFLAGIQDHVPECLRYAAGYEAKIFPRQKEKLQRVLDEWTTNRYFDDQLQKRLETVLSASTKAGQQSSNAATDNLKKESPYIMPAVHGDPSAPYHELPAGNMMPHIVPNTSIPINPQQMRALQFAPGNADRILVEAVKSFLEDVDLLYNPGLLEDEAISMEMDNLGQNVGRDKQTGEILSVESYYGWSKEFCERMKQKQNTRRRSLSHSSSQERDESPRKRRRYGIANGSHSRGRSRSYSRSSSLSPSPSPPRSRSRSRSMSPPRRIGMGRARSKSWSRSRSRSRSPARRFNNSSRAQAPTATETAKAPSQQFFIPQPPPSAPPPHQQIHLPQQPTFSHPLPQPHPPPPLNSAYNHNNHYNSGPSPPPPRPMNWQGPWPPAPPPPPPSVHPVMPPGQGQGYSMQNSQYYPPVGGWQGMGMRMGMPMPTQPHFQTPLPPPPPPPPPTSQQHIDAHGNRYNNNQGYNIRGGYDADRGARGRGGRW